MAHANIECQKKNTSYLKSVTQHRLTSIPKFQPSDLVLLF